MVTLRCKWWSQIMSDRLFTHWSEVKMRPMTCLEMMKAAPTKQATVTVSKKTNGEHVGNKSEEGKGPFRPFIQTYCSSLFTALIPTGSIWEYLGEGWHWKSSKASFILLFSSVSLTVDSVVPLHSHRLFFLLFLLKFLSIDSINLLILGFFKNQL